MSSAGPSSRSRSGSARRRSGSSVESWPALAGLSAAWLSSHLPGVARAAGARRGGAVRRARDACCCRASSAFVRPLLLVTALPFGVVILGAVGLAGAWPALVGRVVDGWFRRAIIAGGGLLWLAEASALTRHDLYWRAARWTGRSPTARWPQRCVWAAAAALTPVLISAATAHPAVGAGAGGGRFGARCGGRAGVRSPPAARARPQAPWPVARSPLGRRCRR